MSPAEMDARHQEALDRMPMLARCAFCAWTFEGPAAEAREKGRAHREQEHPDRCYAGGGSRGSSGWKRRKPIEAQLSESEGRREIHERAAQREAEDTPRPSNPRLKWTREAIVAAIKQHVEEHGRPPTQNDKLGAALAMACRSRGWSWGEACEAAGLPPPTSRTRYRKPLGAGEPGEAPKGTSTRLRQPRGPGLADAGPSPAPSGTGVDELVVTGPGRTSPEAVEPPEPPGSGATRAPAPLPLTPHDLPERFRASVAIVEGVVLIGGEPAIQPRELLLAVVNHLRSCVEEAYA